MTQKQDQLPCRSCLKEVTANSTGFTEPEATAYTREYGNMDLFCILGKLGSQCWTCRISFCVFFLFLAKSVFCFV